MSELTPGGGKYSKVIRDLKESNAALISVFENILAEKDAEIERLRSSDITDDALTDWLCETKDRIGPGCDELALAQAILREFTVSSTGRSPIENKGE